MINHFPLYFFFNFTNIDDSSSSTDTTDIPYTPLNPKLLQRSFKASSNYVTLLAATHALVLL